MADSEAWMRSTSYGVMLIGSTLLLGCSNSETTAPRAASAQLERVAVEAGRQVTGSATILLPNFGNALERYSVSALRHPDGSVTGEFEEYSGQEGGQRIHAQVVCFTVTGNSARLAARIDQTNVWFGPVGSYVVWSVIDNGEGVKSTPDQTTDIFFGGTAAQADFQCRTGYNLAPFFPSFRGNLQVQ
jgi:hypothetical protein